MHVRSMVERKTSSNEFPVGVYTIPGMITYKTVLHDYIIMLGHCYRFSDDAEVHRPLCNTVVIIHSRERLHITEINNPLSQSDWISVKIMYTWKYLSQAQDHFTKTHDRGNVTELHMVVCGSV